MNRIKEYLVVVTICCISMVSEANTGHVIVAFDRAIPSYESVYRNVQTLRCIDDYIQNEFQFDHLYLSVVGYSMNGKQPNIEDFVVTYTNKDKTPILWQKYTSLCEIFPDWPNGEPSHKNYYDRPGSMQSLAKPYCVMETASRDDSHVADATYIFFITDENVQGIDEDYNREWEEMACYNRTAHEEIQENVFKRLQQFNETYRFEFRYRKALCRKFVMASYELLPTVQPSIYSVSNLPTPLPIKRIRGGYVFDSQLSSRDTHYEIVDWVVYNSLGNSFKKNEKDELFIKTTDLKNGDTVEIQLVMRISDDLYGGFLLSKTNCGGMAIKQTIKLHDEAKILGIIPLSDSFWWWYPKEIHYAVYTWDILIVLAFLVLIVYIAYKIYNSITRYNPNNEDIVITFV